MLKRPAPPRAARPPPPLADVAAVDGGFDAHNIPYDVLWLDIEHTDGAARRTLGRGTMCSCWTGARCGRAGLLALLCLLLRHP